MPHQLNDINRRAASDPKGFLEESDELFRQKLQETARAIACHLSESPIVLLAGPSGSGKTTTARKLREALIGLGIQSHAISLDDYFHTIDATTPRQPDGKVDLESPYRIDLPLLHAHFDALSRGEAISVPTFDFPRQMRHPEVSTPLSLGRDEVAIFEGIHALNDLIAAPHPEAFKLYLSARSGVSEGERPVFEGPWARLARRCVRDFHFRGVNADKTMSMWHSIRKGEQDYIRPFLNRADMTVDSFHPYEVNILRNYSEMLQSSVPSEAPLRDEMAAMAAALDRFVPIDPALAAEDALIREFIGGSKYY